MNDQVRHVELLYLNDIDDRTQASFAALIALVYVGSNAVVRKFLQEIRGSTPVSVRSQLQSSVI